MSGLYCLKDGHILKTNAKMESGKSHHKLWSENHKWPGQLQSQNHSLLVDGIDHFPSLTFSPSVDVQCHVAVSYSF